MYETRRDYSIFPLTNYTYILSRLILKAYTEEKPLTLFLLVFLFFFFCFERTSRRNNTLNLFMARPGSTEFRTNKSQLKCLYLYINVYSYVLYYGSRQISVCCGTDKTEKRKCNIVFFFLRSRAVTTTTLVQYCRGVGNGKTTAFWNDYRTSCKNNSHTGMEK